MKARYTEIIDCLKELTETHDFVVIPEFGALVMQLETSEFSLSQNVIFPPRKKILFNSLLKHNDGLLISELQKKTGVEFVLAQTMVNQFVHGLNVLLDTKRRADIEDIGFFYKDINGNVFFESTLNPFYLSESFGLYPVSAIPVEQEKAPYIPAVQDKKKIIRFEPKYLYRAAAVFLVVSLLLIYWWIVPFDFRNNLANIIGKKPKSNLKIQNTEYPDIKIRYDNLNMLNKKNEGTITENKSAKSESKSTSFFSIITGCFKIEQNAIRLLNELNKKGVTASVKWNEQKQLYVVSIGYFDNKPKAIEVLKEMKMKGILKDGWIKEEK